MKLIRFIFPCALAMATPAFAAADITLWSQGGQNVHMPLSTLLVFSALTFAPALLLLMTSFTRIIIVLAILRQALGLQNIPPNPVLMGLALFLTYFVMASTVEKIYKEAWQPMQEKRLNLEQAWKRAEPPLRAFMMPYTRAADIRVLLDAANLPKPVAVAEVPMRVLIPAFVLSELKTAFQMGVVIIIPMLVIDLLVATVLTSIGMVMVPPTLISLPIKLMLFVLVDGWNLLVGGIIKSFAT